MRKIKGLEKYGDRAIVAGAAEGLGAAFAESLAFHGIQLHLIDKDEAKLGRLAKKLRDTYSIEVTELHFDLSDCSDAALSRMANIIREKQCRLMIYNAAYGPVKGFLQNDARELDYYIDVNSRMPLHLAHSFAAIHLHGDPAGFVLMSSMAGLRGTQLVAPYAATKAFDWNLMEGLYYEYKETNLDFTACCAGPIDTPNYRSTQPRNIVAKPADQNPSLVAQEALKGLGRKAVVLPGTSITASETFLKHFFSRDQASKLANRVMSKIYPDKWKERFNRGK